jgi:hypothetical protein
MKQIDKSDEQEAEFILFAYVYGGKTMGENHGNQSNSVMTLMMNV